MSRPSKIPYERADSQYALRDTERLLKRFGCQNFGSMTDWERGVLIVQFSWRGRQIHIEVSWRGYAEMYMRAHDLHSGTDENKARALGERVAPSIVRDWIKGQLTAVECGMMPFEHAFMPHMLMHDGTRLVDHAVKMLEGPPA